MNDSVAVSEGFGDLASGHLRLVEEASRFGKVTLHLWPDELIAAEVARPSQFPMEERRYWWDSCRFVSTQCVATSATELRPDHVLPAAWVMVADSPFLDVRRNWCRRSGVRLILIDPPALKRFPEPSPCPTEPATSSRRVVVTGTFDWFHTGHVRFLEEAAEYGDLYVCVGHDENIRMLKGPDRPLFSQNERAYVVGAMRFTKLALVTTGRGWLDAQPEIERLKPDMYIVNEDGDVAEKRQYCEQVRITYKVLQRLPKPGLTRRSSTDLRSGRSAI